jgi:branched-chain amino acid transport system ATP-binding protein
MNDSPNTPPALLEATGLQTFYGASHVLQGVDFTVGRGETVALLGRNGMGKTTLLRSLTGLTPPREGTLRIDGEEMAGASPHRVARQGVALVPEGRGIFSLLTVREHLELVRPPRRRKIHPKWTLERVFDLFPRLRERQRQNATLLSGGEQQMLAIGRALMTGPRLLMLDEATEGLSPLVAREIWLILRRLREDGIACVVVDKNVAAVSALADRAVLLVKGRVVFSGPTARLIAEPDLLRRHLGI